MRSSIFLLLAIFSITLCLCPSATRAAAGQTNDEATPPATGNVESPKFMIKVMGDHANNYFDDIQVKPGESVELAIALVNYGTIPVNLRTYKVNALNSVNGGYVSGNETDPPIGLTNWIDYPTQEVSLQPNEDHIITFRIKVPDQTEPGQYIAGIVAQTQGSLSIPGTESLRQVLAYAISVSILVPGELDHEFELGEAEFVQNVELRRIRIPITNTGNYLVRPTGELSLIDTQGNKVTSMTIKMGSVYAGNTADLEIVIPDQLPAGEYVLNVVLKDDSSDASARITDSTLTIPAPPDPFGITVGEVTIEQNADPVVFANVNVVVNNSGPSIASTDVMLNVKHDGEIVEAFALADNQFLPNGETELKARYLPADAWEPGTYTFEIVVSAVDPDGGAETILATIDVEDEIVVP